VQMEAEVLSQPAADRRGLVARHYRALDAPNAGASPTCPNAGRPWLSSASTILTTIRGHQPALPTRGPNHPGPLDWLVAHEAQHQQAGAEANRLLREWCALKARQSPDEPSTESVRRADVSADVPIAPKRGSLTFKRIRRDEYGV